MTRNAGLIFVAVIYFGSLIAGCVVIPLTFIGESRHNTAIRSVITAHSDRWDFDKLDQSWKSPAGFFSSSQVAYAFTDGDRILVNTWFANAVIKTDVSASGQRWARVRHPIGREMAYGRYILEIHVRPGEQTSLARVPATI